MRRLQRFTQLSLAQQATVVPVWVMYYALGYKTGRAKSTTPSGFRQGNTVPFFSPNIFRASSDF